MARTTLEDPIKVFRFRVSVSGFDNFAGFSECSGLSAEIDTVSYRECNMPDVEQKSPGLTKFGDITLKRGQYFSGRPRDVDFSLWYKQIQRIYKGGDSSGTELIFRKPMFVTQYNNANQAVIKWDIFEAWPRVYKPMSDMSGNSSENSIEEIVLANEGFKETRLI